MKILITGASSGMGADFARELSNNDNELILVARSKEKLENLKKELDCKAELEVMDLSVEENVYKLYSKYKNKIDFLINNAGFGAYGKFYETDLDNELNMIDLNIKTYHILTKLFLQDFVKKDSGHILNVASSAAFEPGPLMSTYYATKSYVYNLTLGIYEELIRDNSSVKIHVLCPGPVDTGFNDRAKVKFGVKSLSSKDVVKYTLKMINKNKTIIIPGFMMKLGIFGTRFVSRKGITKITYNIQKSKSLQ
ncbi:MAG: SDR family oxidoreductase [Bacilli bacterium]|nr:SDR family oxidoreductase [Bacilli bacterium]